MAWNLMGLLLPRRITKAHSGVISDREFMESGIVLQFSCHFDGLCGEVDVLVGKLWAGLGEKYRH